MGTKAGGYQREANQRRIKVIADSLINEKLIYQLQLSVILEILM